MQSDSHNHKDLYLKRYIKLLVHRFLRLAENDAVNSFLKSNPFLYKYGREFHQVYGNETKKEKFLNVFLFVQSSHGARAECMQLSIFRHKL